MLYFRVNCLQEVLPLLPKVEEPENEEPSSSRKESKGLDLGECPVSLIFFLKDFSRNATLGLFGAIFKDQSSVYVCTWTLCLWQMQSKDASK